jgi:hypothetical protein
MIPLFDIIYLLNNIHSFEHFVTCDIFCDCSCNTLKKMAGMSRKWFPTVLLTGIFFFSISLYFWLNCIHSSNDLFFRKSNPKAHKDLVHYMQGYFAVDLKI